jgi:hypothetical protein
MCVKTWLVFAFIDGAVVKILSTLRRRGPKTAKQHQRAQDQHTRQRARVYTRTAGIVYLFNIKSKIRRDTATLSN